MVILSLIIIYFVHSTHRNRLAQTQLFLFNVHPHRTCSRQLYVSSNCRKATEYIWIQSRYSPTTYLLHSAQEFTASLTTLYTQTHIRAIRHFSPCYSSLLCSGSSSRETSPWGRERNVSNGREVTTTGSFTSRRIVVILYSREEWGTALLSTKRRKKRDGSPPLNAINVFICAHGAARRFCRLFSVASRLTRNRDSSGNCFHLSWIFFVLSLRKVLGAQRGAPEQR